MCSVLEIGQISAATRVEVFFGIALRFPLFIHPISAICLAESARTEMIALRILTVRDYSLSALKLMPAHQSEV